MWVVLSDFVNSGAESEKKRNVRCGNLTNTTPMKRLRTTLGVLSHLDAMYTWYAAVKRQWSFTQKHITPFQKKKKDQSQRKSEKKKKNQYLNVCILKTLVNLDAESGNQSYGSYISFINIFFVIRRWNV